MPENESLRIWGWTASWAAAWDTLVGERPHEAKDVVPARVVLEHGRFLRVHDGAQERLAVAAGRLRHEASSGAALPTVGDWVAVTSDGADGAKGPKGGGSEKLASIQVVLPRKSRFSRRRAGVRAVEQVVAANIDTVFLVMGLDADFNPRRLERYLSLAHTSGAQPVIVLNKADLAADLDQSHAAIAAVRGAVPVVTTNLRDPEGHRAVLPYLHPGQTVALLGSSGAGKSTMINRLAGTDVQRTAGVRAHDGRGRHTTTYAQLFPLPGGILAIDTPGLRELQLWEADEGVGTAFADVEEVAARCRFRDCRHEQEPGCAVLAALADHSLSTDRFASFQKLQGELNEGRGRPGRKRR